MVYSVVQDPSVSEKTEYSKHPSVHRMNSCYHKNTAVRTVFMSRALCDNGERAVRSAKSRLSPAGIFRIGTTSTVPFVQGEKVGESKLK